MLVAELLFDKMGFDMPNNFSSNKYTLKSVQGLNDVGVPHGDGDGPVTPAPGSGSKNATYHVDQHEKLVQKTPLNPS